MITIGSPYYGSKTANMLHYLETERPILFALLDTLTQGLFGFYHSAFARGAVADLRVGANPTPTQIPGVDCDNVVVGIRDGSSESELDVFMMMMRMATGTLTSTAAHDAIFGPGTQSDWIVSVWSQQYDAPTCFPMAVEWHCTENTVPGFMGYVMERLNEPANIAGASSASQTVDVAGPLASAAAANKVIEEHRLVSNTYEPNGTIQILSPTEGQTLEAAGTVTINVQGTGDTVKGALFGFFGSDPGGGIFDLPFVMDINLPDDAVGSAAQLIAVGLDANMVMTDQDEVNLIWDANVVVTGITFGFGDTLIFDLKAFPTEDKTLPLGPIGQFSDGSEHMLSILAGEPNYVSSDETVVVVDTNGVLTAKGKGQCEITVTHSGISAAVTVVVDTYSGDINFDGKVDWNDLAMLAARWKQTAAGLIEDIWPETGDGSVDKLDLRAMCENWVAGTN